MGLILYDLIVSFLVILVRLIAPFNKKVSKWADGRKNILEEISLKLAPNTSKVLWFHCASLGEFEQGRPLMEYIKSTHPSFKILLTFFSPSGYEVRKNYDKADWIFYLPIDTAHNASMFVKIVKPAAAFFVKYEFWYHFVNELYMNKTPIYAVSAIFRSKQVFFKPYGGFMRGILAKFSMIFVQDENSHTLLQTIGIQSVVSGDTRFDRVKSICDDHKNLPLIEKFKGNNQLLVIGSSWEQDIEMIFLTQNNRELLLGKQRIIKVIIAPHEINEAKIEKLKHTLGSSALLYSQIDQFNAKQHSILIIDNVGMLSSIYAYADYAYIGGAFGKGLHNILEAATYGMPIFFGPNYTKFKEAVDLVALGGAFPIQNGEAFNGILKSCMSNKNITLKAAHVSKQYVQSHTGATKNIIDNLAFLNIYSK